MSRVVSTIAIIYDVTGLVNTFRQIGNPNLSSWRYNTARGMVNLRDYIQDELQRRGWSIRELARRARLSHGTVSNLLAGKSEPTPDTLTAIARALGEPPEKLFRMAGLLRRARDDDEAGVRDLIDIARSLDPAERAKVTEYALLLLRQQGSASGQRSDAHGAG